MLHLLSPTVKSCPRSCGHPCALRLFLHLKTSGLMFNPIRVHTASISAFHPPSERALDFYTSLDYLILEGLLCKYSSIQPITPQWDLNLVLTSLMNSPFKLLASPLSMKVAFLVAITSARRVRELGAMMANPFSTFHKDKVSLQLHPKFLLKVVSQFHLNQPIHLATFFPKPHASNEKR